MADHGNTKLTICLFFFSFFHFSDLFLTPISMKISDLTDGVRIYENSRSNLSLSQNYHVIYVRSSAHKNLNEQALEDLELNQYEILQFTSHQKIFVRKFHENCQESIPLTGASQLMNRLENIYLNLNFKNN